MPRPFRHWPRIAVTLIPLVFALLHASGELRIGVLQRLDDIIYDARLRATMPQTLDERIVIVDIDEKSLAEVGRWPWGRNKLARLVSELLDTQKVALLGFDVVFAEADESSGLKRLKQLAENELKDQPGFTDRLAQLQPSLDYDSVFAKSIEKRPVSGSPSWLSPIGFSPGLGIRRPLPPLPLCICLPLPATKNSAT